MIFGSPTAYEESPRRLSLLRASEKVGSNLFLMNRRLSANLNFPFAALSAEGGTASAAPTNSSISLLVSQISLKWNSLIDYFTRIYKTFQRYQIEVPAILYA